MDKRLTTPYDFMSQTLVSDPQISPDGSQVLFVRKQVGAQNRYDTSLWMVSTKDGVLRPFTTGYDDSKPRWSPQGKRVAFVRGDGSGNGQLYSMPVDGGEAVPLIFFPEGQLADLLWSPDGEWLAVSFRAKADESTRYAQRGRRELGLSDPPMVLDTLWYRCDGEGYFLANRHSLLLVNATSGDAFEIFDQDTLGRFSFDFSPDSKKLAIIANREPTALIEPWKDQLFILDISTHHLTLVEGVPECKKFRVRWSPSGDRIAFGAFLGQERIYCPDNVELYICDLKTGKTRSVTSKQDLCFQGRLMGDATQANVLDPNYRWAPDGKTLWASVTYHGQRQVVSVDVETDDFLFHTSGNCHYELGNCSRDGRQWALTRGDALSLPEVYLGVQEGQVFNVRALTNLNGSFFSEIVLSTPEESWIEGSDGVPIQTWVFRPPHLEPVDSTPAVLSIHGGPHGCFGWAYMHDVQMLAAQGYTVVYANPRGSKGYGRAFSSAISQGWAGQDWEDIQSVIAFMQAHEGIEKKRMGVMGASYGGYLANWLTAHSDAFAVAIADRAICNLISFFGTTDLVRSPKLFWNASPWDHPEVLWDRSPLKYVGKVKTPTLILHSEGDLRVNVEQAEQWFTALRLLGVPARFVRYPQSSNHAMARLGAPDLRLHRLEQIILWLEAYLSLEAYEGND